MDTEEPHLEGVDPVAAGVAMHWVESLRHGDIDALWPSTSHDYRLALTQWWIVANPGVLEETTATGISRDAIAEEISTGEHFLFSSLRRVVARDLQASLTGLGDLELVPGSAARLLSPGVELVVLYVHDDVASGSLAPGASARGVTVSVTQDDGRWKVAGLNCFAVPGWPPVWSPVNPNLSDDER